MNCPKNVLTRRSLTVVLTMFVGIGLATALLVFGQVNQALAQGITVDGNGSDWDPSWVIVVDPYDATYTAEITATRFSTVTAHQYARTGFEILSFSVHYDADTWYFKMDTDGRPADADSVPGTDINHPGVGTTGYDTGALAPVDASGLGDGEAYRLYFDVDANYIVERQASFIGDYTSGQLPDTVYQTQGVIGDVAYSDNYTPTGIVEYGIPKLNIFPAAECDNSLFVRALAGSNQDSVADDYVPGNTTFVQALFYNVNMNVITATGTNLVTYTIPYTVSGNNIIPAHNAYITQSLGANSVYMNCYGGVSCTNSGRIITWTLSSVITPGTPSATGIVTSVIATTSLADQASSVRLRSDEGLCAQGSTTFSPTLVSLSELRAQSVGLLNRFWWAALSLAGAAVALFAARRKARAV
jgi:hypothetical protein